MNALTKAVPLLHDFLIRSAERLPRRSRSWRRRRTDSPTASSTRARTRSRGRFVARGVERGDRVVVFADNTVETVVSFWATLKANAIIVIVNPLTKADKLTYLLNDCRAKALVTDAHLTNVFADAARRSPHLATVIVSGAMDRAKLEASRR
ncbi:MAG: class I adenylate-forming enzyme family protein [Polyangiaceae bacterium]